MSLLSGCSQKNKIYIPKALIEPIEKPTPPKVKQKIKKEIAIYIIDLNKIIDIANKRFDTIRKIIQKDKE